MDSPNIGFYFLDGGRNGEFMLRLEEKIHKVKFDEAGKPSLPMDDKVAAFIWTVYKEYGYLYKL